MPSLFYIWKNRNELLASKDELSKQLNSNLRLVAQLQDKDAEIERLQSQVQSLNRTIGINSSKIAFVKKVFGRLRQLESIEVCLSKKQYDTFDEAQLTAWVIYTKSGNETRTEPYMCPACGKCHLTSSHNVPRLPKTYNPTEKANIGTETSEFRVMLAEILKGHTDGT